MKHATARKTGWLDGRRVIEGPFLPPIDRGPFHGCIWCNLDPVEFRFNFMRTDGEALFRPKSRTMFSIPHRDVRELRQVLTIADVLLDRWNTKLELDPTHDPTEINLK